MPDIQTNEYGDEVVNDYGDPVLVAEPVERIAPDQPTGFWANVSNAVERGIRAYKSADLIEEAFNNKDVASQAGVIARIQGEMADFPASESLQRFNATKTAKEALSEFIAHPVDILSELSVESAASFFPTMARKAVKAVPLSVGAGAAIGSAVPGVGTGVGAGIGLAGSFISSAGTASFALEASQKILDSFIEAGVDVTDGQQLASAFNDKELMTLAKDLAVKKGVPIAVFDAVSAGVAGKLITKPAKTIIGKAAQLGGEVAVQATLGGAGEAAGEFASGEQLSPSAILGEALAEVGSGVGEIAGGAAIETIRRTRSNVTVNQVQAEQARAAGLPVTAEVLESQPAEPSAEESFAPKVIQPDPNAPTVKESLTAEAQVNEYGDPIVAAETAEEPTLTAEQEASIEPAPTPPVEEQAALRAELDEEQSAVTVIKSEMEQFSDELRELTDGDVQVKFETDGRITLRFDASKINEVGTFMVQNGFRRESNTYESAGGGKVKQTFLSRQKSSEFGVIPIGEPNQRLRQTRRIEAERLANTKRIELEAIEAKVSSEVERLERMNRGEKVSATPKLRKEDLSKLTEAQRERLRIAALKQVAPRTSKRASLQSELDEELGQTDDGPSEQALGITPGLAGATKAVADFAQKNFTAEGNLPTEVFQENVTRVGKMKEQMAEARYAERDLKRALQKEFSIGVVEGFVNGLKKVPAATIRQMNAVLRGEVDASVLPESLREPISRMRAHVDALSAQMLEKGLIDGKLAEIVGDNLGVYLTRSYRVFDDPEWASKIPIEVRNRARAFILSGLQSKNPAATMEDADRVMRTLLEDWRAKGVDKAFSQGRLGNKDLSLFMKRKDIAPEIRALMGEYETPVINYMKSISRIARLIADQEFLNEVRRLGMGKFLFEDGTQPRGFDTQIAAEQSDTMSPLNGLRTTPEIAEAFKEFGKVSRPDGLWRQLLALNAVAKGAKTIGSFMTQARNLTGQPFFWAMSGHWNWKPTAAAIKAVGADIGATDSRAWRERYRKYVRLGIVDDSTQAQELRDAFKDGGLLNETDVDQFTGKQLGNNLKKLVIGAPARAYQISDELGKIVGFENEVVRQQAIHPEWTQAQVEQEAATRIRNTYPTYSMVPEVIRKWRRQPIFGPFISFAYETFRTTYWNLRYMMEDLQSGNEAQKNAGVQRMAGIAAVLASGYALSALTRGLFGISPEEEDDLRQFLPPWAENSELLFTGKDDNGNLSYLNLSYLNPYSYLTDPFIAAATNLRDDETMGKAVLESMKEFMSPFINEQIATAALIDIARNQTSTGKQVYNPQDPDKFQAMGEHLLKSIEPGTIQRLRKRILPAFQGQETEFGRVLNPTVEVAREVTGLNTETTDFKQAIAFKASEFRKAEPETENIFRILATKRGVVTDAELVEAYQKSEQTRFSLYQDFFDDIQAARRRGVSDNEIFNAVTARGVGKEEARRLLKGFYMPYEVSSQMKARLKDLNRKLPMDQISAIQKDYRKRNYKVN